MEDVMSEPVRSTARCGSPSAALKLIRAAALAAALVPLGSIAAEAGPITCVGGSGGFGVADSVFPGTAFSCETVSFTYSSGTGMSHRFWFDGFSHSNTLTFLGTVLQPFELSMSAFYIAPDLLQPRLPAGSVCEEYALSFGPACVYYRVEDLQDGSGAGAPPRQGMHFTGNWEQEIVWYSQDGPPSDAQLWHDPRPLGIFDHNITTFYDPGPTPDPLVRGSTDNFSDTVVIPTEVPEPSSLLLLGLGIGGLYRRVRRR
jgi:hypothetical protein